MEQFLEALEQAAVFLVAAKVILHFFPGNKYDRYGKMMTALIVLSMLAVPALDFVSGDFKTAFWEEADRLEAENEMFSRKLEGLSQDGGSIVENGVVLSVEESVGTQAQAAGVEVGDVYIEDGVVVIEVELQRADAFGKKSAAWPVEIGRVEWESSGSGAGDAAAGGSGGTEKGQDAAAVRGGSLEDDAAAQAGAGAVKEIRRPDLARSFAEALGMEEGKVEVIERR